MAYAHAAAQRSTLSVERFAGDWAGVYKGDDHGYCLFRVELTGQLAGYCQSSAIGYLKLSGSVDASGKLVFTLSDSGASTPSFSGTLSSPGHMNGTWLMSTGGGGTWYMMHQ